MLTSGNVSDEPIALEDRDAVERLAGIADLFLMHDRPIHVRLDDSVTRVVRIGDERRELPIRRSRGYVPGSVALPVPSALPLLACGAEQKNTFCRSREAACLGRPSHRRSRALRDAERVSRGNRALRAAVRGRAGARGPRSPSRLPVDGLRARAGRGASSSGYSITTPISPPVSPSTGLAGAAVGAIYDGTGYGADGTVWGGELLVGDLCRLRAHRARSACADAGRRPGDPGTVADGLRLARRGLRRAAAASAHGSPGGVDPARWQQRRRRIGERARLAADDSMGRLFDAVAALCGIVRASYEGQAAVELEAAAVRQRSAYASRWARKPTRARDGSCSMRA